MTKTTLSTDILRRLALMQHLGEGFLILNGIAYGGNHQELWDEWRTLETSQTFDEFVAENCTEVEELDADDYTIDYMVLTDDEADEKWEESLDNYIEECIQPEIDKLDSLGNLQYYIKFNEEMWKRDAKMDGRGHSLSSYDGHENEETVEGETFYIYRTN